MPWARFWYNTFYHHCTGLTHFKIVYGRDRPPLLRHSYTEDIPWEVQRQLEQRDEMLKVLKLNIRKAQERMKHFADRKRSEVEFAINDLVLVKLQP